MIPAAQSRATSSGLRYAARVGRDALGLLALGAALGLLLGVLLSRDEDHRSALVSVPVALQGVDWADIEASHRANDAWVDDELPGLLGFGDGDATRSVDYRLPDSLQITSASLAVTGPTNDAAQQLAEQATDLLIQHQIDADAAAYAGKEQALQERIDTATTRVDSITATLDELRTQQFDLIRKKATEAEVSKVTGDIWATETERVEWERELSAAQVQLSQLQADRGSSPVGLAALGDPRVEQSVGSQGGMAAAASGAMVGLWVAAILAYWWNLRRGRLRADHPILATLGVPVNSLGNEKGLDTAATQALASLIDGQGMMVSLIDVDDFGASEGLARVLTEVMGVDDRRLLAQPLGADESFLVGTLGILVAVAGQTRANDLAARYDRCRSLDVPVQRIVLIRREAVERVQSWASTQTAA